MTTHSTRPTFRPARRVLTAALAAALAMTASTAQAGSLELPAWDQIFSPGGALVDHFDAYGGKRANGIPDHVDLFGGIEAEFVHDNLSNGVATDMTALLPSASLSQQVVFNGEVRSAHDLGNVYLLKSRSPEGSLQVFAGVERLLVLDSTFIEFEFNQQPVSFGPGAPWTLNGHRSDGDLLVRMDFSRGNLSSVEVRQWAGDQFTTLQSRRGGAGGCQGDAALVYCVSAPPMEVSGGGFEVWDAEFQLVERAIANDFVELGIDLGQFAGDKARISSVQVRTPEDLALNTFGRREPSSEIPLTPVFDGDRLD